MYACLPLGTSATLHASAILNAYLQELTAKARQLQMTTEQLQQLQGAHDKVQSKLTSVKEQLQVTSSHLEEAEELRHRSEAQVVLLQDKLEHADVEHQQLTRQVSTAVLNIASFS